MLFGFQTLAITAGGMFSFVVAELRGAMARFLQIAAQRKSLFSLSGYRAATTSMLGINRLSFITSCYKWRAKTVTNKIKYTVLLAPVFINLSCIILLKILSFLPQTIYQLSGWRNYSHSHFSPRLKSKCQLLIHVLIHESDKG